MWKKIFVCFLCCLLVAIPFVQRSYAAVTTITVVTILILTLLSAMGITLVVAEGTKEAFIADKGDSFMSSKGYSGSFADWISGGTPMDISLKLGTLMVAKAVVDRIKEFVNWLVPGAASNVVVDLSTGSLLTVPYIVLCSLSYQNIWGNAQDPILTPSKMLVPTYTETNTLSDGNNVMTFDFRHTLWTGYYDDTDTFIPSGGELNNTVALVAIDQLFYMPYDDTSGQTRTCYPGIYFTTDITSNPFRLIRNRYKMFNLDAFSTSELEASAIISDYDDLSDLTTTTTEGSGGTTIVNNTFYITQSGQALNPSSQDLADIVGALQQALDDLEDRMKVQPMTADAQVATQVEPPYNDFQLGNLDLSQLGALLTTRFPFSIPWDLKRIFDLFVVDPVAPHWELNLFADSSLTDAGIDGSVSVDLGNFPIIGIVTRWFCIIEFCLFLAAETKKYIWTA